MFTILVFSRTSWFGCVISFRLLSRMRKRARGWFTKQLEAIEAAKEAEQEKVSVEVGVVIEEPDTEQH